MLITFASRWLALVDLLRTILLVLAGIFLAAGIYFIGFSRLALQNIRRIGAFVNDRVCLFAF